MKLYSHIHLFLALFSFIFSSSIEANDLITPSLSPESSTSSIPLSHISSSPNSSPSPSPSSDPNSPSIALESFLKSAALDSNIAIVVSKKLLRDPATTYMMQSCLSQCVENYSSMVDDLMKAIDDLQVNDFYMLSEDLSAIEDEVAACQECFTEMVGSDITPLKPYEDSIISAASQSLAILENYPS